MPKIGKMPPPRPVVEALEPKLLYSADLGLGAFTPANEAPEATMSVMASQADLIGQEPAREIAFIDATVTDVAGLVQDIQRQAEAGRNIEVVVIRADEDGISRITQTLQGREDIGAIHLVGHGYAGGMHLGTAELDAQSLMNRAGDIAQWGSALGADGDLLIYGCDVALGTPGHDLVQGLSALTGADVAASDDLTGAKELGGDWVLEVRTGQIDGATAFSAGMQGSWQALLLEATPSSKGTAIWAAGGDAAAQQQSWDGLTMSGQTNTATLSTWKVMTSADSPTRNESIAVGVDASGTIRAQRWDGTQWTALPTNPLATGTVADRQGFAVAYEQVSGDAVLVWNNGSTLRYSVFNGTTWTAAASIGAYNGAAPHQMRMVSSPLGDGMVLVVSDANGDDRALVWNGSTWGNAITLDETGTGAADQLSTAVAYENISGHAMVAYTKAANANVYYRMFNGSAWSNEAAVGAFAEAATPLWLTLASDPTTDRIALGMLSTGAGNASQVSLVVWNGNAWGTRLVANSYTDATPSANVALAFESRSGDLLAVYGSDDSALRYRTWTNSGGWSAQLTGPTTGAPGTIRLYADPATNHIMMGMQAETGAVSFTDWNGSAFGSTDTVTTQSGSTLTPAFTWVWRNDISGNKTNTLLVGSGTDASGWRGVNEVGDGEVLEFGGPDLAHGDGSTYGSFSHILNLEAMGAQGVEDIVMVSRDLTVAGSFTLARGDMLFTTGAASTLVNADGTTLAVNEDDVVRFRPTVAGRYDQGTFTVFVQSLGATRIGASLITVRGPNVRGLALVEQSTTVAGTTLAAGTLVFTSGTGTAAANIQYLTLSSANVLGGVLVGANANTLITGSNINVNQAITGLEVVSVATPMKNVTLSAGSLLFTLEQADNNVGNVGSPISMNAGDVAVLTATSATQASATMLMRGSNVGVTQGLDSLALSLDAAPVITSNGGGTTASISVNENSTFVTNVVATDADADTRTYSISGGNDAQRFQIDATTGMLSFGSAMNFEDPVSAANSNAYQVIVSVSDGTYVDTQTITVNVVNVAEAPTIEAPPGMSSIFGFAEYLAIPTGTGNVLTIRASDPEGGAITYSLSGVHASRFSVNSSTGLVKMVYAQNTDGLDHLLTLVATDATGLQATYALRLETQQGMSPSNDFAPVLSGNPTATVSVTEGTTFVTDLSATDGDFDSALTYAIGNVGNASLFEINAVTGVLRFKDAPVYNTNGTNTYTVQVAVSDGPNSDTQTITVNVLDHNDAPANTLPAVYSTSEDNAVSLTGISVTDGDASSGNITATFSVQHGTLTVLNSVTNGVASGGIAYANGNRQVTLTGTLAAINATLANANGLRYQADGNYAGADTLTMVSNDQGNSGQAYTPAVTTDTDTALILVSPVADVTVVAATAGSLNYTENAAATPIDPGFTLNDVDGASLTSATVRLTGNYVSGQDVLSFVNQNGFTGSWDAGTGTLTITGSGGISDWQSALRAVSYRNTSDNPNTSARTATFSVTDAGTTVSATRGITVTAVNDLPVLTSSGGALAYTENGPATAINPGLTVSDADSSTFNGATVRITGNHAPGEDVLSFANQNGITGSWNAATGTLTLSGNASVANYQAALRSVQYRNTSDNPSTAARTVTYSIDEGNGAASATRGITVAAVNDPATLTTSSSPQTYVVGGPASPVDSGVTLTDPDNATLTGATIRITTNYDSSDDQLSFTNQLGITGSWNSGNGTLTLSGTASVSDYQTALRSVAYVSNSFLITSYADRTVVYSVNDGGGAVTASRVIQMTNSNAAPTLTTTPTTLAYTEGDTTPVDPGISLSDSDTPTLTLARIQITGQYKPNQDELLFTDQLGLTGSWNASTGTLTLSGGASVADFETALRSVTYRNSSDTPASATRTVTFTVVDGGNTVSATRNLAVSSVNDAPVLSASLGVLNYAEDDAATAIDPDLAFGDPDATTVAGATIQITGHYVAGEDVLGFVTQAGIVGTWNASNATLTLSGNASPADYEAALRSVTYRNTANNPDTTQRTVTFSASDGSFTAVTTRDIAVSATNDAAVVTPSSPTLTYTEGSGPVAFDAGLTIGDADSTTLVGAIVSITGNYLDDQDQLLFTDQSGITGVWDAASGTLVLSGTASLADYESALRSVRYLNSAGTPDISMRTVTITVDDGLSTGSATRHIAVALYDDAPTLTTSSGSTDYTESGAGIAVDPGLSFSDEDTDNFTGATVRITGNHMSGEDELGFVDQLGITGVWNANTGTLTLSGAASAADYETALRSVTYRNTSSTPFTASRVVTFGISDGASSVLAQKTVTVLSINDVPVIVTTGSPLSYTENAAYTVVDAGLTLVDADEGTFSGATVQITGNYVVGQDLLAFTAPSGITGITGSWDADTGTLTLTGTASTADYQAALRAVTYRNTSDDPDTGTRTVTFTFGDGDGTATGTRDIGITPVNDAPGLITSSGSLAYNENDAATAIDNGLTLADLDDTPLNGATVQITGHYTSGQDLLSFTAPSGITGITASWDASTGTLTLSGTASMADYEAALRGVAYRNTADNPDTTTRTVTFTVDDGAGPVSDTRGIAITPVNDAPVPLATSGSLSITENAAATAIDPGFLLTDIDSTTLSGATVKITTAYTAGEDILSFANQAGITGSWDSTTGTLTLSGTASLADYQAALRSVQYRNASDNPNTATRTVTFTVDDGGATAATGSTTRGIEITPTDDAPSLGTSTGSMAYTENDAATAIDSGLNIIDIDAGTLSGASVRITGHFVAGEDLLSFTDQAGITGSWDASTGTLTLSGTASIADYQTALRSVAYRNSADNPDTTARTVTFRTVHPDGDATATRGIAITAVNDASSIGNSGPALTFTENTSAQAIATNLTLSDVDSTSLSGATVRISGAYAAGQDTLAFVDQAGITGSWNASTGTLTLSGTASITDYQAALRSVTYINSSDAPVMANRTVTFQVDDGAGPVSATQGIVINAIDDAPELVSSSLNVTQGGSAVPVIVVADIDSSAAALTLTVSNVVGGRFTNAQTSTTVTQFTYAELQAGQIRFEHDGTYTVPAYTVSVSDGHTASAPSTAGIAFTLTPIATPAPAPVSEPAATPPEVTEPETKSENQPAEEALQEANLSQAEQALAMAAPSAGQETMRALTLVRDPLDTSNNTRFTVDLQTNEGAKPQSATAPLNIDSFRLNWSGDLQTLINPEELRRNLDALQEQLLDQGVERRSVVASSIALTTGLSVGYVIWLVRGGALLGSMLSAMPAWQMIDPLPVLTRGRGGSGLSNDGGDDQPIENIFDDHHDTSVELVTPDMPEAMVAPPQAPASPEIRPS